MSDPTPGRVGWAAGASLAAFGVYIAANGQDLIGVAKALFEWVVLVWAKMPAGVWSFVVPWLFGLAVIFFLRSTTRDPGMRAKPGMHTRIGVIEMAAGLVTFLGIALQMGDPRSSMIPLMFAAFSGLTLTIPYRFLAALGDIAWQGVVKLMRRSGP